MERLRSERTTTPKALMAIIVTAAILFRGACSASMNHTVGGVSGWDLTSNLKTWTSETTFHVGDSLVFSYTPVHDVVEVGEDDYESCVSSNPITTHNDGESVVPLTKPGTRFFICGRRGHCDMGLKLRVQVLAAGDHRGGGRDKTPSPPRRPVVPSRQPRRCDPGQELLCLAAAAAIIHVILSSHFRGVDCFLVVFH